MSTAKSLKGIGEWLTAIGILGTVLAIFVLPLIPVKFSNLRSGFTQVSLAVFFAGVLLSIKEIKTKAEASEETLAHLRNSFDCAQKYGPTVNTVAGVVNSSSAIPQKAETAHVRAGGETLGHHINEELPVLAQRLLQLHNGHGEMKLVEPYFVSGFLNRLQKLLPEGCVWCGVSRLTRGWDESNEEPGFSEFREGLRTRSEKKQLAVLRVYEVRPDSNFPGFRQHIDKEVSARISARITDSTDAPDISLLWHPLGIEQRDLLQVSQDPVRLLFRAGAVPICGLLFETRFASMFHSVSIVPADSGEFQRLLGIFANAWDKSRPVLPPHSSSPPDGIDRRLVEFRAA